MIKKWLLFTSQSDAQEIIDEIDVVMGYKSPETCAQIWVENVLFNKRYLIKLNSECYSKLNSSKQEDLLDIYPSDFVWITE
tara:strand:+ start:758 stop:1000 length:243 start_codon:yes stop_codon:yes gene_type:complete